MPPANEPQMSEEEISLLEWWIDIGAPSEGKLASFELPTGLESSIAIVTDELIAEIGRVNEHGTEDHPLTVEQVAVLRAPIANNMATLQSQFPGMVRYLNDQTDRVTVASYHHIWSDDDIRTLSPITANIVELVLPDHRLGQESAAVIATMQSLEKLDLRSGHLDNAFIETLTLPNLRGLNLYATGIAEGSLNALCRLTTLEELYLGGNELSSMDIEPLQASLVECSIFYQTASFTQPAP